MSVDILTKSLWDARRSFLGWAIGLAGAAGIYTSSYALIEPTSYEEVIDAFPTEILEAMGWDEIATPTGYLGSTVFGLVVPILAVIFAIAVGTRFLAGDEESGTMELTLTHPVSRTSLVLQRAGAALLAGLGASVVVSVAVMALAGPVGLDVPASRIMSASFSLGLMAVAFAMLAVAIGAWVGRRGIVLGACSAVAVFAYFASTVLTTVDGFEWLDRTSLFYYYGGQDILEDGLSIGNLVVLIVVSVVLVVVAVIGFQRRDVGTG
ncbi:MAG: ABC transporter permease [Acidimicrobiia bacterium]|nr:ABC transporter permease [Acidimicrobiia bacterium]